MSSPMSLPAQAEQVEAKLFFEFDAVVAVTAALVAVSTIAVGLRCYVRGAITRTFGWDDATMVAAWAGFILTAILTWIATYAERILIASGKLVFSVPALVQLIRYSNAAYTLTMLIVKVSIGIFFLKLFAKSFKWQRIMIITILAVTTSMGIAYLAMTFATCGIMVQSQRTTPMHTGTDWCPIQSAFVDVSITWSVLNAVGDIIFTLMAVHVLWSAKMNRGTKISACLLIVLGSAGCVASIARVAVQLPLTDIRMSGVMLAEWSNIEAGMSIIAGSLITLRPLIQPVVDKTRSMVGSLTSSRRTGSQVSGQSETGLSTKKSYKSDISDIEKGRAMVITREWTVEEKDTDTVSSRYSRS